MYTPHTHSQGLDSVRRIVADQGIVGVHGPLIELVRCNPRYVVPVEVTAGDALFDVVVDTDATASRILAAMNRNKVGLDVLSVAAELTPGKPVLSIAERHAVLIMYSCMHVDGWASYLSAAQPTPS